MLFIQLASHSSWKSIDMANFEQKIPTNTRVKRQEIIVTVALNHRVYVSSFEYCSFNDSAVHSSRFFACLLIGELIICMKHSDKKIVATTRMNIVKLKKIHQLK